ncbi:MAG: DUF1922 domain-containing protein [Thermoproteota archaeon]
MYLVFMCPKCGAIRYAPESQKTAKCFGCGYQVPLGHPKVRILEKTENNKQARAMVQEMKLREATK